jgi:IMP dehydrogenase
MAGNVVTPDATKRLRDAGAKFVRVGVGSGAACSTRLMTGFGYPQLSAIQECAEVKDVYIVADGGIRTPGDMVKALAFGAHLVMIGRMLAGTHYTPGKVERKFKLGNKLISHRDNESAKDALDDINALRYYSKETPINIEDIVYLKTYRGMASKEVNTDMFGELGKHRAAEGESYTVPYKDEAATEELWQNIVGGIRSGCTYAGAVNLKELREKKQYVVVSANTVKENSVHGKG